MADIAALRLALRDRIATTGLRAYSVMPPKPEPPAAGIAIRMAELDLDADGNGKYTFDVWIYVNPADLTRAQSAIDPYLSDGALSIKAAIDADSTLGGACDYARMTGWVEGPRLVDAAGTQLLAMPVQVEVMA